MSVSEKFKKVPVPVIAAAVLAGWTASGLHASGGWFVWQGGWILLGLGLAACGLAEWRHRQIVRLEGGVGEVIDPKLLPAVVLFGGMLLFSFSTVVRSPWFFFFHWPINDLSAHAVRKAWIFRFFFYTALLTPLFLVRRWSGWMWVLMLGILLYSQAHCLHDLLNTTKGLPLYRDDHPSFMYRLWTFPRTFPQLIYYDPFWNGGKAVSYLISSGTAAPGLALWPVWKWGWILNTYTPALGIMYIILIPFSVVAAVRLSGGTVAAAFAAGTLALGVSRVFFLWLLHFGTVGACFALPLLALLAAIVYAVLWRDLRGWWLGALLVVTGLLYAAWPPAVLIGTSLAAGMFFSVRAWSLSKWKFLLGWGLLLALLCLPYLVGILTHIDVGAYVGMGQKHIEMDWFFRDGWKRFLTHLRRAHPLLVFMGLLGVWFVPDRRLRTFFAPVLVVLALFAGWGHSWKPHLEFTRAGIPLLYIATIPAAIWIARILETRMARLAPVRAGLVVLLVMTGMNVGDLYRNRGVAHYCVMNDEVRDMVQWIRTSVPAGGRVMFAGKNVHGYGGGHIAILPVLTGHEMMACDYYHFSPKRVEYEYPPRGFRGSAAKIFHFCELYNVTHIVTYHKYWMRRLDRHPEFFRRVHEFGQRRRKVIYEVQRNPGMFLVGSGSIQAGINKITVHLDDAHSPAVIKYNWDARLSVEDPVRIEPFAADESPLRFIRIIPNGQADCVIHYRRLL